MPTRIIEECDVNGRRGGVRCPDRYAGGGYALCAVLLAGFIVWADARSPGSNIWILAAGTCLAMLGCVEFLRLARAARASGTLPERWEWVLRLPRGFAKDPVAFIALPAAVLMMAASILAEYA